MNKQNTLTEKIKLHAVPTVIMMLVTFAFSLITCFSFYSNETFGHDAGIFAYIGYAITKGQAPYTGAWDNKGPLLYLIDALGIFINYRYGIFFLEILTLFITIIFFYKTALLFVPRWTSLICAVFCMLPLTATLEGGNLSEEYALPFTAAAFYFIAKFFCNDFILKKYEMMIVGACIGAVFLLRLNILAFLACAVLGVIIVLIKNKNYNTLLTVSAFALLGFLLFLTPFVIYLIAKGAFVACIDSAYLGTLGSFSPLAKIVFLKNITQMIINLIPSGAFFLIAFFLIFFPFYAKKRKKDASPMKYLAYISFFGLIATLLANSLSGALHMHYFMSFIPVMIIPVVWFADYIHKFFDKQFPQSNYASAVCAVIALTLCISCIPKFHTTMFNNLRDGTKDYLNTNRAKVSHYLIENSEPTDTVLVLGDASAATSYYKAKRFAASNYFYYANGRFSNEAKNKFADEIQKDVVQQKPKLIMFSDQNKFDDFSKHLSNSESWHDMLNNEYSMQENDFNYIIYKRNS